MKLVGVRSVHKEHKVMDVRREGEARRGVDGEGPQQAEK